MRQFLFIAFILLIVSCKKTGTDYSTVQYEFSSDVPATYRIDYSSDVDLVQTESFQGTSWSKTVIAKKNPNFANITLARLVAYPPSTWTNTTTKAHVNMKITANGVVRVNADTLMTSSNVGAGILQLCSF